MCVCFFFVAYVCCVSVFFIIVFCFFFFFNHKTDFEIRLSLVGSEMFIRDRQYIAAGNAFNASRARSMDVAAALQSLSGNVKLRVEGSPFWAISLMALVDDDELTWADLSMEPPEEYTRLHESGDDDE